jgi:type IV pilus assembly protein PilN
MIRINLLPHREAKRKEAREQFYALSMLMILLAGLVWLIGYNMIEAMAARQSDNNRFLQSEIAVLDKQIEDIKKLREQTTSLIKRKQVIESLQANRTEIVHLFNDLARNMPSGLYLQSLKQEGQKISLSGYAQSSARVSSLMHMLDQSPLLDRPVLIEIKAVQLGKRRMNEFSLSVEFSRQNADDGYDRAGGTSNGVGK